MPPTTNRRVRPINADDDANPSLLEQRESKLGDDSDSLMSVGASEEDDGDEDEDEIEGESRENGVVARTSHVFKIEFIMPPYEHAKRQLSQLFGGYHLGNITQEPMLKKNAELMNGQYLDLEPHYQRGVVWSRRAMRLLIDSMWKGYYIPPVGT